VLIVDLDEGSRRQQVRQGFFSSFEETPARALSMSIPALLEIPRVLVTVPEQRKAAAVRAALEGPITRAAPASVLRTCPRARLHLDRDAASQLSGSGA
jgi:glucosamine-6-phosphate deaminase